MRTIDFYVLPAEYRQVPSVPEIHCQSLTDLIPFHFRTKETSRGKILRRMEFPNITYFRREIFFKSTIDPFLVSSLQVSPCYRYSFNRSALNTRSAWLVHKRSENKTFARRFQHKRFPQYWYFVAKYLSRISQHATRWMFSRWWIVLPGFVAATNIAHKSGV